MLVGGAVVVAGTDVDVVPVGTDVDVVVGATVEVVGGVDGGATGLVGGVVGGRGIVGTVTRRGISGTFGSFEGSGVVVLVVEVVDVVEVEEVVLDEVVVSSVEGALTGGPITTGADPPGWAPDPGAVAVAAGGPLDGPSSALFAT